MHRDYRSSRDQGKTDTQARGELTTRADTKIESWMANIREHGVTDDASHNSRLPSAESVDWLETSAAIAQHYDLVRCAIGDSVRATMTLRDAWIPWTTCKP